MSRIFSFLSGFVCGIGTLCLAMNFHVVRASDGHHLVPKARLSFQDAYVDIRQFGFAEWRDHGPLAEAILKAKKDELLRSSAESTLHNALDNALESFGGRR